MVYKLHKFRAFLEGPFKDFKALFFIMKLYIPFLCHLGFVASRISLQNNREKNLKRKLQSTMGKLYH